VIDAVEGDTTIDSTFASTTVTVVAPLIEFEVAVIEAVPAETPVTSPVLLTVAVSESEDDHVAELVRFFVLLFV
jgi:hypothetical protein